MGGRGGASLQAGSPARAASTPHPPLPPPARLYNSGRYCATAGGPMCNSGRSCAVVQQLRGSQGGCQAGEVWLGPRAGRRNVQGATGDERGGRCAGTTLSPSTSPARGAAAAAAVVVGARGGRLARRLAARQQQQQQSQQHRAGGGASSSPPLCGAHGHPRGDLHLGEVEGLLGEGGEGGGGGGGQHHHLLLGHDDRGGRGRGSHHLFHHSRGGGGRGAGAHGLRAPGEGRGGGRG